MTLTSAEKRIVKYKGRNVKVSRIPTDKERASKVKKKGGFDDSWYDKKAKKRIAETHICFYCHKPLKPVEFDYTYGKIRVSCDTPGCIGNFQEDVTTMDKEFRHIARVLDKKLCYDLEDNLHIRDISRRWAGPRRLI